MSELTSPTYEAMSETVGSEIIDELAPEDRREFTPYQMEIVEELVARGVHEGIMMGIGMACDHPELSSHMLPEDYACVLMDDVREIDAFHRGLLQANEDKIGSS